MKKQKVTTVILVIIFLIGLCVLLYPSFSNYVNSRNATTAINEYNDSVAKLNEEEYENMLKAAKAYNKELASNPKEFVNGEPEDEEYKSLLNLSDDGMMGYITIESLDVNLPIYHGTASDVLAIGAGHLEGSSLPVGGKSTHSIISGHRGLPSAKLFTDLDDLQTGDTFTITILKETLTYEVDQIRIVLPEDISETNIVSGEDYITLVTCTPYGVNTHRLLVRGHRIKNQTEVAPITADALQIDTKIVALFIAVPILLILLIWVLLHYRRKKKSKNKNEQTQQIEESHANDDEKEED